MSDSIADMLAKRSMPEPPEIAVIKRFVQDKIGITPRVAVSERALTIHVPDAGSAGALRPHIYSLQAECNTKKRLIIRIG